MMTKKIDYILIAVMSLIDVWAMQSENLNWKDGLSFNNLNKTLTPINSILLKFNSIASQAQPLRLTTSARKGINIPLPFRVEVVSLRGVLISNSSRISEEPY